MENSLFEKLKYDLYQKNSIVRVSDSALAKLPKPSQIPFMSAAAKRILKAFENNEKVLLVGDYDVDGITATSLMILAWRDAGLIDGVHFEWIVPDRFKDGYGVSVNMVNYAIEKKCDVIITVDNGITAVEAVKYAKEKGLTVIITDHHTPGDVIPEADIIVDLKYKKGKFPMVDISGCTIAFFFQAQLKIEANKRSEKRKQKLPINEIKMENYADLVGISVISDVMPLYGMNIGFYRFAIKSIKAGKRLAYSLFYNENKKVTLIETDLSFGMIPAMNAVGRISHAKHAVILLTSTDMAVVQKEYEFLEEVNRERKRLTLEQMDDILPEAKKQVKDGKKAIIIHAKHLHEGIVGILAGRLAQDFELPSYVFGYNEEKGIWKGSGRSTGKIDLFELTKTAIEFSAGFGGHVGAVGVGIKEENFNKWSNVIWDNARTIKDEDFKNNLEYYTLEWKDVNQKLVDLINSYRPYGESFPEPIFVLEGKIHVEKELGTTGQHWSVSVTDNNGNVEKVSMFHNTDIPNLDGTTQKIQITLLNSSFGNNLYIQKHGKIL